MEIKILGTGCSKCKKLAKVTELEKIMSYSVMSTPALVIDGVVKITGRVPTAEELKQILK